MKSNPRIFIGLEEIAGYNAALKAGFDQIGVAASFVSCYPSRFYGNQVRPMPLVALMQRVSELGASPKLPYPLLLLMRVLHRLLMVPLLLWALFAFDVFVYTGGSSFLFFWELHLMRLFKKRTIVVFHGSDSRPPYINGKYAGANPRLVKRDAIKLKRRVRRVERLADVVINHPPSAQFHERPFVRYMAIGMPFAFSSSAIPTASMNASGAVRIVHAPSNPEGKGTPSIRSAIERLKQKGHAIDYVEIINMPNSKVLEELARCDFVVDELYSDAVMAKFATEAAYFGKPAIVGGYATEKDWGVPENALPPVYHCHPDAVEAAIEDLVVNAATRKELGAKAKCFVDEVWSEKAVASRFMQLVMGEYPTEWLCDPRSITYLHGWGLTEAKLRTLLQSVVSRHGVDALQLEDNPFLSQRFLDFLDEKVTYQHAASAPQR